MSTTTPDSRLNDLDAVRAFALLLGVVFHASLSFMPIFIGWAVMDVSTSDWISIFVLVSHSFRMELFFLIAGFFSHMTFHRRGRGVFLASRLVRIGIPFVVGWFVLRPLIVSGWVMGGQSLRGDVDVIAGLAEGLRSLASLPAGLFLGTHLWFLYYLLLVTALVLLARAAVGLLPNGGAAMRRVIDRGVRWVATSPFGSVALVLPSAACLWFMSTWGMDTPDQSLLPDIPVLGVYSLCFALGWLLHRQPALLTSFARLTGPRLAVTLVAVLASVILAGYEQAPGFPHPALIRILFVLAYATMMWGLVTLCIGLFRRFLDRPNPAVRYMADASYWLYLVHLPIVVWLQVAVAEWPIHWTVKLVGIFVVTVGLSLLVYDLLVRTTLVGKVLNGQRKPRALTLRRRNGVVG